MLGLHSILKSQSSLFHISIVIFDKLLLKYCRLLGVLHRLLSLLSALLSLGMLSHMRLALEFLHRLLRPSTALQLGTRKHTHLDSIDS